MNTLFEAGKLKPVMMDLTSLNELQNSNNNYVKENHLQMRTAKK